MLKVAKLFQEPKQSLILSSKKVKANDGADKSLSKNIVHPITQPKSLTNLKLQKKRIPPSSKPKSSYKVRVILPKKQVVETQHAEETVATANATQSLEASKSAEDQVNQLKTAKVKKVEVKESGLESIGDVTFDQLMDKIDQKNKASQEQPKSPYDIESEIKIIKRDSTNNDSKQSTAETFNASADMPAQLDPLGHLYEELCTLNTKVDQLESSISKKVTDDIQSFIPSNYYKCSKSKFSWSTLRGSKNTLPQVFKDSIQQSVQESIEEKLP
ncbi:hypothetical protein Tco_0505628 [Tanacetum coccineum]